MRGIDHDVDGVRSEADIEERWSDRLAGALPEVRHKVLAGGAMRFYGLN